MDRAGSAQRRQRLMMLCKPTGQILKRRRASLAAAVQDVFLQGEVRFENVASLDLPNV